MNDTHLHRTLGAVDKPVHRLGLSAHFGLSEAGVREAFERGINYVFWTPRAKNLTGPLKEALAKDRESMIVATGPTIAYFGGSVTRGAERLLKKLDTDYIDVFHLFWVGVTSGLTSATLDALATLKDQGKVRAIAVSIHDRPRAGELAKDSPLDLLMVRYNAAHPGAESDIFPHVGDDGPSIVAYTATRWRKLLKRPKGWDGPVMTAGDCYRFCLSNPVVDVVLCGPKNVDQLRDNLDAVEKGPLTDDELAWIREFGASVHG